MALNVRDRLQRLLKRGPGSNSDSSRVPFDSDGATVVTSIRPAKTNARPPLEATYAYVLAALVGYMAADLAILSYREHLLPQSAPPLHPTGSRLTAIKSRGEYERIISRNIFNSDGVIPSPLKPANAPDGKEIPTDGPAVPTTLTQLTLIGTLVHANPARSVATIEIKGAQAKVLPYFLNDEIETLAQLLKIERKKAIFRNYSSGRLEYIEIKDDTGLTFGRTKTAPAKPGEIQQQGNSFSLKRSDLNGYLNNLDNLLQQATAVPNIPPGGGGQIDGFRLIDIAPGSLYEKLGLKRGDVIKGVNGESVDSPSKALELYNSLKNSGNIVLDIERNGNKDSLNYRVTE